MNRIITSLLETDLYKFSMGQAIFHQFPGYETTWSFKCRNSDVKFTTENGMDEIIHDPKDSIWESDKGNYVEISKSEFMEKLKEFTDKYLPND